MLCTTLSIYFPILLLSDGVCESVLILGKTAGPHLRSETMAEDGNASRIDNASMTLTDQRPLSPFLEVNAEFTYKRNPLPTV